MQSRVPGFCLIEDYSAVIDENVPVVEEDSSMLTQLDDVADLATGYAECMAEAMRYLVEVENYPPHHPAVLALKHHLDQYRKQLLRTALYGTGSGPGQRPL